MRDDPATILRNTQNALYNLAGKMPLDCYIASPKINAGLFRVPWEDTEALIHKFLEQRKDISWRVYEI